MNKPIVKWLITIGVGVLIAIIPAPMGVPCEAWTLLAIFVATIVGSILQPPSELRRDWPYFCSPTLQTSAPV